MKKLFILTVACFFAFVGIQAQSSEVEASTQLTKTEQFKMKCSFIKENVIGEFKEASVKVLTILYTDLKTGEQLSGLEFFTVDKASGIKIEHLGYLDADQVNDFLLALETILKEAKNITRKETCSISYTAPGGIDVYFYSEKATALGVAIPQLVVFSKKWIYTNEFGIQQSTSSQNPAVMGISKLASLIESIKEAQIIAQQVLNK